MIMTNESFDNVFDSSLVDYSKDFEEQDKFRYDKQHALDWVFTNCCDVKGNKLQKENVVYNPDKTIDILKNGLCMRGHNFGKVGKSWTFTRYADEGEDIEFIPDYVNFRVCWGSCDLGHNHLKSLRGCPRVIMPDKMNDWASSSQGDFWCNSNDLRDLEYFPEFIGGSFDCCDNKNMVSVDGINLDWIRNDLAQENSGHYGQIPCQLYDEWTKLINTAKKLGPSEEKFRYDTKIFDKYGISKFANMNESFENVFDSSLIDYSDDFEKQDKINLIKNWIEQSTVRHEYYVWGPPVYGKDYKINDDLTIDTLVDIYINVPDRWYGYNNNNDLAADYPTELPDYINFNIAHGTFTFHNNSDIKSLRGCPKQVYGAFCCEENSLKTLEGGPELVTGNYNVWGNKLISLKGAPKIIGTVDKHAFFNVYGNRLTSLEDGPEIVYGTYSAEKNKLTTTKGFPKYVKQMNIKFNNHINPEEFREWVAKGSYDSYDITNKQQELFFSKDNKIEESFENVFDSSLIDYSEDFENSDIEYKKKHIKEWCNRHLFWLNTYNEGGKGLYSGVPAKITINDDFSIDVLNDVYFDYMNNLGTGSVLPDYIKFNIIHGDFLCGGDKWIKLDGFPEKVEGTFNLSYNTLKTYKGFPKSIGSLELFDCRLNDFKDYLPIIEKNPKENNEETFIKVTDDSLSRYNDFKFFKYLIKKYKGIVDTIETQYYCTDTNGWNPKINESFDNIFDSSLIDYSEDFEKQDELQAIKVWVCNHIIGIGYHVNDLIWRRDIKEEPAQNNPLGYQYEVIKGTDGSYFIDIKGNIKLILDKDIHEIPYKIGSVMGDFMIGYPEAENGEDFCKKYQLWSLKNMPTMVYGNFNIKDSSLENLEGSPLHVSGDYIAIGCHLKSIKGLSNRVMGQIILSYNDIQDSSEDFIKYLNINDHCIREVVIAHNKTDLWSLGYDKINDIDVATNISISR